MYMRSKRHLTSLQKKLKFQIIVSNKFKKDSKNVRKQNEGKSVQRID